MKNWVRNTWVPKCQCDQPWKVNAKVNGQSQWSNGQLVNARSTTMTWCWLGTRVDVELGLTWRSDRLTRGRDRILSACGLWHGVTTGRNFRQRMWRLMAAIFISLSPALRDLHGGGGGVSIGGLERKPRWRQCVYGGGINLWWQRAHRNFNSGSRAMLKLVEAAKEHQKRRILHKTLRAMALIAC